jgi:hypothetical protein
MANKIKRLGSGLVIIPISTRGTSNRDRTVVECIETSLESNYLKILIEYSLSKSMDVVYLTGNGILYQDDIIKKDDFTLREAKVNSDWCYIVSEEVYRLCLKLDTNYVMFLTRSESMYKLTKVLRSRGILVDLPIMGIRDNVKAIKMLFSCGKSLT